MSTYHFAMTSLDMMRSLTDRKGKWKHWKEWGYNLQYQWQNNWIFFTVCCFLVSKICQTLCNPMDCSKPGFPVHHQLPEHTQIHFHWVVLPSNHLILCHPLLLPPSIFPSIRGFSNESVLLIKCTKYLSSTFSMSPSNEYSGLISFRIKWFGPWTCSPKNSQECSPTL